MKAFVRCALVAVSLSWLVPPQAVASSAEQEVRATVILGDATAPPEWELPVPISLAVPEGAAIGRLTVRLSYPKEILNFLRVEKSPTLKHAAVEVTAEPPTPGADVQTAVLLVEIGPAEGNEAVPLPAGMLASLVFQVAEMAETGSWPMDIDEVRAWGASPSFAELEVESGPAASITVASAGLPIFACFFYMH